MRPVSGKIDGEPRRLTNWREKHVVRITCSASGAFVGILIHTSQSDIYISDIASGSLHAVRRMTFEDRSEYPHSWTADSSALVFEMPGKSGWDLFIQKTDHRIAIPLSTAEDTEITPQLSPDGKWILFCAYSERKGRATQKLMRIPVGGGQPQAVAVGEFDEFRCALNPGKRCVVRTLENRQYIYSELDPLKGRGRELARTGWVPGVLGDWALSADGMEVAVPNHDPREARITLVPLDGSSANSFKPRELQVPGLGGLRGLIGAADNRGWFASLTFGRGVKLVYIRRNGRFNVLRESPVITWGLPSPDGKRLAFVDQTLSSNLWSIDRY
jgi:hypothetical protein